MDIRQFNPKLIFKNGFVSYHFNAEMLGCLSFCTLLVVCGKYGLCFVWKHMFAILFVVFFLHPSQMSDGAS